MRALVVYESMFGNTELVAQAITTGLSEHMNVELLEVAKAPPAIVEPYDLVVVGGPTHAFSMTRPQTREEALTRGATHGSAALGIREWLAHLPEGPHAELVATFDTRVAKVRRLPGSAAKGAAKMVRKLGYSPSGHAESFYVSDVEGPLVDGELDRARSFGERLGSDAGARATGHATT